MLGILGKFWAKMGENVCKLVKIGENVCVEGKMPEIRDSWRQLERRGTAGTGGEGGDWWETAGIGGDGRE